MKIDMKITAILLLVAAVTFILYKKRSPITTSDELHRNIPPETEPKDVIEKVKSGELPADYKTIHDYVEKRRQALLERLSTRSFMAL